MESWFPTFQRLANREIPLPASWPPATTAPQRHAFLRLMALALEDNLPLYPLIEQWAQDERGVQGRRLKKLAHLLKNGTPLADAVEEIPGLLSDEDLLAIRFDAQLGTRTAAVRRLLDDSGPNSTNQVHRVRGDLIYVATVLAVGLLIIAFVHLKIVPVFQKMFQEFGLQQPQVMRSSIHAAHTLASLWWLAALAAFILLWCMLSTQTGRFVRHSIFSRLFRPLRELHAADVLQKIGIASAAGRPVAGALSTLARYHFAPTIRHKLLFVRNEVEQGAEVWRSLTAVGLISPPEMRLLKTADRVGNRPWVLKQLAAVKQRRTQWRLQRAAEFVLPALVLLLGALVLFQALTIFEPLVKLIEGLL